jgi:hypothetical protein
MPVNPYLEELERASEQTRAEVTPRPLTEEPIVDVPSPAPVETKKEENPFLKTLEGDVTASEQLNAVTLDGAGKPPQLSAEVLDIQRATGLPLDFIERNLDVTKQQSISRVAEGFARRSPHIGKWMRESPYRTGLIYDDLDNLGRTEATFLNMVGRVAPRSLASGAFSIFPAMHGINEQLWSLVPGSFADSMQDYSRSYRRKTEEIQTGIRGDISEFGPTVRAVAGGFESIGAQVPAVIAGILSGGSTIALGILGGITTGQAFGQGAEAGLSPFQNLRFGLTQGAIEIVTEIIPMGRLLGDIAKKTPLFRLLARQIAAEVPTEQVATLLQDMTEWTTLNPTKTASEFLAERPGRGYETLVATVVATVGMSSIGHLAGQVVGEEEPKSQKELIIALGALSDASKVRQRSPETYDEIMTEITRDSPFRDVFIPASIWNAYWEEQGENPNDILLKLGAGIAGEDVTIPIQRYASEIANTPHGEALNEDIRVTTEARSIRQVREFREKVEAGELEAEISPEDQVKNSVKQQLLNAGVSEADATIQAEVLYGNPFRALAERIGMDPVQMFEELNIRIGGERVEEDGQTFDQAGRIVTETPAFKAWFGESKVVDEAGEPLQVFHGTSTEFEAFDPEFTIGGQFWFTSSRDAVEKGEVGAQGRGVIQEVYLSLKNPAGWDEYNRLTLDEVIQQGFDGFALPDKDETTYVAFEPTQIKSVFAQRFDPTDPRILEQAQRPEKRRTLADFVRKTGGLKTTGEAMKGELLSRFSIKEGFNLLNNKTGLSVDAMAEAAWEAGYFTERPSAAEFLDTLRSDVDAKTTGTGTPVYSIEDVDAAIEAGLFPEEPVGVEPRARITFGLEGIDIELLKRADKSSFIHETGHLYLEVMRRLASFENAPADIIADYDKILKWFGVEEGQPLTEEHHEQWARGFEAFLFEGKSPNAALKKAFKQFQQWLMEVYQSLTELNVELTDDVRDVMGRMLVVRELEASGIKGRTDAQLMARRREQLKIIKDYLGLSDGQMKKLTKRRNIGNMTNYEWKQFKDDLLIRAEQIQETAFAKARLMELFNRKRLRKVDNYRKTLGLPPVSQMSIKQLDQYTDALEEFEDDDVFLGPAQLSMIDFSDLEGVRTWREAKERLAKEAGVSVEVLNNIDVGQADFFRWDSALREQNPFYRILVDQVTTALLAHEARAHKIESEVYALAKKSEKSRGGTLWQKVVRGVVPQDEQVFEYLESDDDLKQDLAKQMTPEQVDLASYMQVRLAGYLDYLIKVRSLERGRDNYFIHLRKSFLETLKSDGLGKAVLNIFKSYEEDEMSFKILSDRTGDILPLNKHFRFAMRRTGGIDPTRNVVKAFMVYVQTIEKKMALDTIMTKMDIYAQSISPTGTTKTGLATDQKLKDFVYKYINNKKGRRLDFGGVIPQGQKIDLSIRALRTFTSLIDLGGNIYVGASAIVGEAMATAAMLGPRKYTLGVKRMATKKGRALLKKYEVFTGRSAWEEFWAPGKELPQKLMEGLFFMFHVSSVTHNKQFLIGSITKDEYNRGEISDERLAQLKLEMGRMRVVPGTKSLIGSTSLGGAGVQYKSWAIVIARTIIKDIRVTASRLKQKKFKEAVTAREAQELYRVVYLTFIALVVHSFGDDEDDNSFMGQLMKKIKRESLTLLGAINPSLLMSVPRSMTFLHELGKNLEALIKLEEYKTKPGLKGAEGLKRQFTPRAVKNLTREE